MKLSRLALAAALAWGFHASQASAQEAYQTVVPSTSYGYDVACDSVSCDSACCDSGGCQHSDPFSLFGEYCGISAGGWLQMGYHSQDGGMRFNNHADRYNLHQAWLYAEKAIDTRCGFDVGGRVDYLYGVDAQDTQAFGTDPRGWDNDWDNGIYGHALPQAYVEAGYGDLSVRVGKFFSIIGYEVIPAPNNFFYSHSYSRYNNQPFTHTGALATYAVNQDLTLFGGYTLGWDSGFDDNGDSFLGGFSAALTDDVTLTYATSLGRFGEARFNDVEQGEMHSLILATALTNNLQYVIQSDYLDTDDGVGNRVRNTFGVSQYLLYNINDCWSAGTRVEWWNVAEDSAGYYGDDAVLVPGAQDGNIDVYDVTFGVNYRPNANVLIRPEIRWDFVKEDAALLNAADIQLNEQNRASQATFGIDTIFLF